MTVARFKIEREGGLLSGGNIGPGTDENIAGNPHDLLIRSAARRGRQVGNGFMGDIDPDDGKVTVTEFVNVRAAIGPGAFAAVGMGIRSESS